MTRSDTNIARQLLLYWQQRFLLASAQSLPSPSRGPVTNGLLIGTGVGLFEEFYVHSERGNWMRDMHPLRSIPIYVAVIAVLYFVSTHIAHLLLGRLDDLPTVYRRLPFALALFTLFSLVGVLMMRIIHFVGLETLFHLLIGTYHRPVQDRKVLLFLDINGSTALGTALGPLATRALVRKFLSDVSQPITDFGAISTFIRAMG